MMVRLIHREEVIIITPYELLELVRRTNNTKETIEILNNLLIEIDNSPRKYINKLSEEIEEFAQYTNRCPFCGNELKIISYKEDRGEYQGSSCAEEMYEAECSSAECDYIKK